MDAFSSKNQQYVVAVLVFNEIMDWTKVAVPKFSFHDEDPSWQHSKLHIPWADVANRDLGRG